MTTKIDNLRKAAVLVAALDRATADRLLERFDPEQAQLLRRAASELDRMDDTEQESVVAEFVHARARPAESAPAGIELDGTLAQRISWRPVEADDAPVGEPVPETLPFRFLHEADSRKLARILQGERPQTVALVISHLPRARAGEVLAALAAETQVDIIRRLVDLDDTSPDVLRDVERGLETRLSEQVRTQRRQHAGLAAVAEILQATERFAGARVLHNLAGHDRQLAARLGYRQLEFEDLAQLDDFGLASVFQAAGAELSLLALTGSPPRLIERVLRRLTAAEAAALRDQLNHPQPVRLRDVERAREEVARLARDLAAEGRIDLPEDIRRHSFSASA